MNIIIADDNKIERLEILRLVKESKFDFDILESFTNGEDAFNFILKNKIDIVISDIQMPKLTGIELIELINQKEIKTKVIFVSCYDDFHYLKSAINNNATDYILKPIIEKEFYETLEKTVKTIEKEKSLTNEMPVFGNEIKLDIKTIRNEVKEILLTNSKSEIHEYIDKYICDIDKINTEYVKNFSYCLVHSFELILDEDGNSIEDFVGTSIWEKLSDFNTILNIKEWLYNLFCAAMEVFSYSQIEIDTDEPQVANRVKAIIHNCYTDKITTQYIANKLHFSPKHINFLFNKETGKTIFEYLTEYRIEKAKELLNEPDSKIYLIAQKVGYQRKSHFYDVFKAYTGMTPAEYKTKIKSDE